MSAPPERPRRAPAPGDSPGLEPGRALPPEEERRLEAALEREGARRARRFQAYAQAGGIAFLAVVSLGLLPTILSATYPAAGERAAILVWIVAPAVPIALLVVAALRFPR